MAQWYSPLNPSAMGHPAKAAKPQNKKGAKRMSKKTEIPSSRRHILVYDEDWDFLEKAFGPASQNRMGVGPAIRNIIHVYVGSLRHKAQRKIDAASRKAPMESKPNEAKPNV